MYKMPKLFQWIFPKRVWAFSRSLPKVYLTFDDGPIPEVTPWVLQQLEKHQAKATFFCIGDNVRKHPNVFEQIVKGGHSIGNHTRHHLNGWKTNLHSYLEDVDLCDEEFKIENLELKISNPLFRPPYGRITSKQSKKLQKLGYKIIMWDVLTKDYDATISEEKSLKNTLKAIQPGSIIVFHDSLKAENKLKFMLPRVLEHIEKNGWKSSKIEL